MSDLTKILEQEGIKDDLSSEEMAVLLKSLTEYQDLGHSPTLNSLYEEDFWRTPPNIEEFLEDDYWLGKTCSTDIKTGKYGLFPFWKDLLINDVFAPDSQVIQLVLGGAIGQGKTTVGCICVLYKLARVLCMKSPLKYFGQMETARLITSFFSVTQKQVAGGSFSDAVNMMNLSPFFREKIKDNYKNRQYSQRRLEMDGSMHVQAGSQIHEALGGNVLFALIDELNFRREADAAAAAKSLVDAISRRIESRFTEHTEETFTVLISSANDESDYLAQYIRDNRNNPKVRIVEEPYWKIAGAVKKQYSGETFMVDCGDNMHPPKFLTKEDAIDEIPSSRLLEVPEEERPFFESDLPGSIRDKGGRGLGVLIHLFQNSFPLINSIADDLVDPFINETIKLSVGTETNILDYIKLNTDSFLSKRGTGYYPTRHPNSPRFIHMDLSSGAQDAMGIAMVHPIHLQRVKRFDQFNSSYSISTQPVFELDFALRIMRESSGENIDFQKVRQFIMWLSENGFTLGGISYDLETMAVEMSSALRVVFDKKRDTKSRKIVNYLSMDKKKDGYMSFKQVVMEGRFRTYKHDYMLMEMVNLENGPKKIDHPKNFTVPWAPLTKTVVKGSKDIADSVAGAISNAQTHRDTFELQVFEGTMDRMTMIQAVGENAREISPLNDEAPRDNGIMF